jgi:exonuclease SbcC
MVPLRLHLHNFLSYGDSCEPIDLDGIHVACLCGPNGHGKSALLDAMTWALWGQARTSAADDLVRLGQKQMFVELEFRLDTQRYRVIRKRSVGRNSQSDLQFQVRRENGEWSALTGQGVRGTQERIVQALRMDYETFINSAFLLQGRADEFARKTAGDRKRILGEILGLGVYDQLCDAARARRAEAQATGTSLELEIGRMEAEHARLPELEARVERLTADLSAAQLASAEARAKLQEVLVEKARMDARRRERDDLLRRLATAEAELKGLRDQLATSQRKVEAGRTLVAQAKEIRARVQEYHALTRERDELTSRLASLRVLEQERAAAEKRLQEEKHRLLTQLRLAQARVTEINARAEQIPHLAQQVADLQGQSGVLDRLQEESAGLQARLQAHAAEQASASAELERCQRDLADTDDRFQRLKDARAVCPVCEGELTEEKRLSLGRKLREEKTTLKEQQGGAIQRQAEAKRAEAEDRRRLQQIAGELRTGQAMRDRLARAQQELQRCEASAQELPRELKIVGDLEEALAKGDFAPELAQKIAELEQRIREQSYDESAYRRLAARLGALGTAERDLHALERAEADLPEEERHAAALEGAIRAREESMAEDRAARAEADRELARAGEVDAAAVRLQAELAQAEGAEASLSQQLGAAREMRERCAALAEEIKEKRKARAEAANDQAAYEELAKAFGRNGIQALIIENALPEVENEANALLARMSDGQLQVRLKTQRDLKAGGQAETLEIEISDGMGARRYELYSGGEAFRVNFAIRIALSKLLARRAGAPLQTLFIDEGFGSQDTEGRQRLVEAIQAVQDDFDRIMVITHIEELKDQFPTRIEVTKGLGGSQVAVF